MCVFPGPVMLASLKAGALFGFTQQKHRGNIVFRLLAECMLL